MVNSPISCHSLNAQLSAYLCGLETRSAGISISSRNIYDQHPAALTATTHRSYHHLKTGVNGECGVKRNSQLDRLSVGSSCTRQLSKSNNRPATERAASRSQGGALGAVNILRQRYRPLSAVRPSKRLFYPRVHFHFILVPSGWFQSEADKQVLCTVPALWRSLK